MLQRFNLRMTRNLIFSIDEYYHLYDRGCDKRPVFMEKSDYRRFLMMLFLCNDQKRKIDFRQYKGSTFEEIFAVSRSEPLVAIGAYCLMENHIHLLIKELIENGTSKFIQKLLTGYTMYFNKKYERTGALFGGHFKASHLNSDEYLKYIYSYIHLNPIKIIQSDWKEKGIKDLDKAHNFLENYKYSSYLDYAHPKENRVQKNILNFKEFPEYFTGENSFEKNINDWLTYEG